jgi:hypothetical protein
MFSRLDDLETEVAAMATALDPALLTTTDAASALVRLARIRNGVEGMITLLAARAEESGVWASKGHRHPEDWLANVSGTTPGAARRQLETSKQLTELPATTAKLKQGTLSPEQTRQVVGAATASAHSEQGLLATAATGDLEGLRKHAERVKAGARSAEEEARRLEHLHRTRGLKRFTDPDGAEVLRGRFTPDVAAALWARLEHEAWQHNLHQPPQPGQPKDTHAAQLADALVRLTTTRAAAAPSAAANTGDTQPSTTANAANTDSAEPGTTTAANTANTNSADSAEQATANKRGRPRPNVTLNVIADWTAMIRGHTVDGETCELDGFGPIPVSLARMLADDCYLRVLLTDGTNITHVAHASRYIPAHLRTALEIRDTECAFDGCHHNTGLQIDHNQPVETQGPTALWNLHRLCWWHHLQKTIHDWRLTGPPGHLTYCTPAEWEAARAEAARASAA